MFTDPGKSEDAAAAFPGVRLTSVLLGFCAVLSVVRVLIHLVALAMDIWQQVAPVGRNVVGALLFAGFTWLLIKTAIGLLEGVRWALNAAQFCGALILLGVCT